MLPYGTPVVHPADSTCCLMEPLWSTLQTVHDALWNPSGPPCRQYMMPYGTPVVHPADSNMMPYGTPVVHPADST